MKNVSEMTREDLAIWVLELMELRDKLLDQNKSYRDLALKAQSKAEQDTRLEYVFEKIARKHKTVSNILFHLRKNNIDHETAEKLLKLAILQNKQFTESQVLLEVRKL